MKRLLLLAAGAAMLLTIAVFGDSAGSSTHVSTSTVADYDLDQLGLDLQPLDATALAEVASGKAMDESAARAIALSRMGDVKNQPEILHVMARPSSSDALRPVWLYLFKGSTPNVDQPWGPAGDRTGPAGTVDYTGVMIDDKTGEVVVTFLGGHQ